MVVLDGSDQHQLYISAYKLVDHRSHSTKFSISAFLQSTSHCSGSSENASLTYIHTTVNSEFHIALNVMDSINVTIRSASW